MGIFESSQGCLAAMLNNKYLNLKRTAYEVPNMGGFDYRKGEMNPEIARTFFQLLYTRFSDPVAWEPFAGNISEWSKAQDWAASEKVELISYDLDPRDARVIKADSTRIGPPKPVNGVIFHPSYFGAKPFSQHVNEVANCNKWEDYKKALGRVCWLIRLNLLPNGWICAIGRDYRYNGQRVRLDELYIELFEAVGFKLEEVWTSIPDVVLLFRRI